MKRIFPTILFVFIIITLFTIPTIPKNKTMRTNLEIDSNITFPQQKIYVKNKDNYFVQIEVFITNKDSPEEIIEYLKIDNNHLSTEWNGYIPKEVKIREYKMNNNHLEIHFSEELKKIEEKRARIARKSCK